MKLLCLLYFALSASLLAQTATLRGVVTDGSGAAVPSAKITIAGKTGVSRSETSDRRGAYTFTDLAPGAHTLQASAPRLYLPEVEINLVAGMNTTSIRLSIASIVESIHVEEAPSAIGTDARSRSVVGQLGGSSRGLTGSVRPLRGSQWRLDLRRWI